MQVHCLVGFSTELQLVTKDRGEHHRHACGRFILLQTHVLQVAKNKHKKRIGMLYWEYFKSNCE